MIELVDSQTGSSATISAIGASLLRLNLSGNEVIEELSPNDPKFYGGVVMAPWSSRIENGKYSLPDGRQLQVPINEPARSTALHGLVYNRQFQVARTTESSVELTIEIEPTDGYPFHLKLAMSYELEDGELFASFAVKNLSRVSAPFGMAFHPYFSTKWLGEGALIQSDARTYFDLGENLIGHGKLATSGSSRDLSVGKVAYGAALDDGFTDLSFDKGIASTKMLNAAGSGVEVWQEDIFKHLVIYTTDTYPTEAGVITAVAIEPSTSEVNAFNTKMDLLWLKPEQTISGSWGARLV